MYLMPDCACSFSHRIVGCVEGDVEHIVVHAAHTDVAAEALQALLNGQPDKARDLVRFCQRDVFRLLLSISSVSLCLSQGGGRGVERRDRARGGRDRPAPGAHRGRVEGRADGEAGGVGRYHRVQDTGRGQVGVVSSPVRRGLLEQEEHIFEGLYDDD